VIVRIRGMIVNKEINMHARLGDDQSNNGRYGDKDAKHIPNVNYVFQ
jgi:hypothetical protein